MAATQGQVSKHE